MELAIRREFTSLTRREADIALRLGPRPTGEDVVVRRVSGARVALFCRHDRPQPQTIEQLREQSIVAGDEGMARTPTERWMTEDVRPRKLVLRSDSMLVRYHAVRSGAGIGFCPCFLPRAIRNWSVCQFGATGSS